VVVLFLSSILWGLSWLPLKFLNQQGFEGIPLLFISQGLLALLFIAFGWRGVLSKRMLPTVVGIAFTGGAAILCFTSALVYGEVIRVMVLFYLLPIWGVLGGKFILGEQPDWVRWLGVCLALSGAFLILGAFRILDTPPSWIDFWALASGLLFAANNMFFRAAQSVPLSTKLLAMFFGCALLSGLLMLAGVQDFPSGLESSSWWWIILYTFCWVLLANMGSQWGVTHMEAGRSSIIIIMELVSAVISALIIAGERLSVIEWCGCVMVITAAFLEAGRVDRGEREPRIV